MWRSIIVFLADVLIVYFLYNMLQSIHKDAITGEYSILVWISWSISVLTILMLPLIDYLRLRNVFAKFYKYRFYGFAIGLIGLLISSAWSLKLSIRYCYIIPNDAVVASMFFGFLAMFMIFVSVFDYCKDDKNIAN